MQQSTTPIQEDELQEGFFNPSWPVQDTEINTPFDGPMSDIRLQRPSRSSKLKSTSSTKSKPELIKVSKVNVEPEKSQKPLPPQTASVKSVKGNSARQCRVCLEGESEGRLIRPCRCTGSMQYIHQHCLNEWIKRKMTAKPRAKVHCEVCEEPFDYKMIRRLSVSWQMIKQNFYRHRSNYICFFIVMAVLLVVWFGILAITCLGLSSDDNWVKKTIMVMDQTRVVFICVLIVYLLIMVFVCLLFVAEYGIKSELFVKSTVRRHNKTFRKVAPKLYAIAT